MKVRVFLRTITTNGNRYCFNYSGKSDSERELRIITREEDNILQIDEIQIPEKTLSYFHDGIVARNKLVEWVNSNDEYTLESPVIDINQFVIKSELDESNIKNR